MKQKGEMEMAFQSFMGWLHTWCWIYKVDLAPFQSLGVAFRSRALNLIRRSLHLSTSIIVLESGAIHDERGFSTYF